jgi:hypothetical protein
MPTLVRGYLFTHCTTEILLNPVFEDLRTPKVPNIGRVAFKRRVTPLEGDHVFALPYASCLSTFRAPGWGKPAILPPCRWRNATPWELVPFSHRLASRIFIMQPGCTPPPAVTQDGDLQFDGGGEASRAAILVPPSASRMFIILAGVEAGLSRSSTSRAGSWVSPPSAFEGEGAHWPCEWGGLRQRGAGRQRASSASARWACRLGSWRPLPPQGWLSRRAHGRTAQDVARCQGGVRVRGRSCLCTGMAPLRGGRCSARPGGSEWGSAGGLTAPVVGAEAEAAREVPIADGITATIRALGLRLFVLVLAPRASVWARARLQRRSP